MRFPFTSKIRKIEQSAESPKTQSTKSLPSDVKPLHGMVGVEQMGGVSWVERMEVDEPFAFR